MGADQDAATGSKLGNAAMSLTGTWSYATTLAEGNHTLYAIATDVAGNTMTSATQTQITVDRTAPAPTFSDMTTDGAGTYTFKGTALGATTVSLFDGASTTAFATGTVASDGTFTLTGALSATATHNVILRATDLAGNVGTAAGRTFIGSAVNNTLTGGAGADLLYGAAGNDTLAGGALSDTFIFKAGFGRDTINTFTVTGADHDVIQLDHSLFPQYATVEDLLDSASIAQVGANVVLTVDAANTITITNTSLATLKTQPADFHFV